MFFISYHQVTPVEWDDLQWIQGPDWQECMLDTSPEAPSSVEEESIVVSRFEVSGNKLNLNMSWAPPEVTYGNITSYEVKITREPLPAGDESTGSTFTTVYVAEVNSYNLLYMVNQLCSQLCLNSIRHKWRQSQWLMLKSTLLTIKYSVSMLRYDSYYS